MRGRRGAARRKSDEVIDKSSQTDGRLTGGCRGAQRERQLGAWGLVRVGVASRSMITLLPPSTHLGKPNYADDEEKHEHRHVLDRL